MSTVNAHDNGEESYSMYPKTSSSPLPAQGNMHFPAYQPPVPIYAYPQVPYMYAGQTPGYPFSMMNQSQMVYQGGTGSGIPQQNGGMGPKKKWNNDGNSGSSNNNNISSSKVHQYHHHQSSPSYHPASTSSSLGNNVSNGKSVISPRSDQYKFYAPKSDSITGSMKLPLFFNTDEKGYLQARSKRHALRLGSLTKLKGPSISEDSVARNDTEKGPVTPEFRETKEEKIEREGLNEEIKKDREEENKNEGKEERNEKEKEKEKEALSSKTSPTHSHATIPVIPTTNTAPAKPVTKSWSAVASNAVSKEKAVPAVVTTAKAPNASASHTVSKNVSQPQSPQRKDKNYIPPSTKGMEPLGSIALRMCYDPDFIDYTLKTTSAEKNLTVNSIVPRGIVNRANICFMSSVLQVLLYCKPFVDILNVVGTKNPNSRVGVSQCRLLDACIDIYKKFDKETFENEKKGFQKAKSQQKVVQDQSNDQQSQTSIIASISDAINPDEFYNALSTIPKFKDLKWGHQEDAEEFLTHLLDQLHEEFISSIDSLTENEIQNLLQSINDQHLKIFFIRNLPRYKKADFIKNASIQLKELIAKYDTITENDKEDGNGWHEVSGSSRKGKKTKSAAKRTVEVEPSPMSCLFGGQFRSVLDIPNNKESQSITLDPFQTIQLDISDKSINDLETAFKKFSEYEFLPFKSSSGNDVEAKKQTFIDKLPQVLLIQLKRFQFINNTDKNNSMVNYNAYNGRIEKIRKKINYDHELIIPTESTSPLTLQQEDERRYILTGVIYHHGLSSDGGHYTADVYHKEVDKWYRIDDVNIIELEKSDVLKGGEDGTDSRTAYILMYQKS